MHPVIEQHRAAIRALAAQRGIENVRVFGSMARGDASADSDIDLLVSLPPGRSGLALGGLLMDIQDLTQRKVDVVTEAGLHPALRERVLREACPL
jgi:predicted nucleotidyltransferase